MQAVSAAQAARMLGISLDTLRRWDRAGQDRRSSATRRTGGSCPSSEIERLRGDDGLARALGAQPLPRRRPVGRGRRPARPGRDRRHRAVAGRRDHHPRVGRGARAQARDERGRRRQVDERDGGAVRRAALVAASAVLARALSRSAPRSRAPARTGRSADGARCRVARPRCCRGSTRARASFGGSNQLAQQVRQGSPVRRLPLGEPGLHAGALRRRARAQAGRVRDEQPRPDRPAGQPRQDRDGARSRPPAEAAARRGRAEGADRPLHA